MDFHETKYYTEEKKHFSEISVRFPLEYFLFLYLYIYIYIFVHICVMIYVCWSTQEGQIISFFPFLLKVRKILENKNKIQKSFSEPYSPQQYLTMHIDNFRKI